MSLKNRIRLYAKNRPTAWINGGDYERLAMGAGYKASNCSRRLRELHEAGILERREVKGSVEYRYVQKVYPVRQEVSFKTMTYETEKVQSSLLP